jgi:hypothetical protein
MSLPASHGMTVADIMIAGQGVFRDDWTPDTQGFVEQQAVKFLRDLRRYRTTLASGKTRRSGHKLFLIEHSFSGRFCALLISYPQMGEALTLASAKTMADQVRTRSWCGETVNVTVWEKPEGGTRTIINPGPLWRAADYLLSIFLAAKLGENPFEYARRGRGRDRAISDSLLAFKHKGVRQYVQGDLKEFYRSINTAKLHTEIPLPKAFVESVLCIPPEASMKIHCPNGIARPPRSAVRTGIPPGLRSSGRVASHITKTVLAEIDAPFCAVHGDDILIGLRKDDKPEAVKSALRLAFAEHPCGPLLLKTSTHALGKGRDYLGYSHKRRRKIYGGYIKVTVSRKAIRRCQMRVARRIALLPFDQQLCSIEPMMKGWARSFGAWDGRHDGVDYAVLMFTVDVMPILIKFRKWIGQFKLKSLADAQLVFDQHWLPRIGRT